ncbi:MAG TPA: c-type cytochrome domain-containing protein [Chitinophagaceae bacterium]|nr:c-type cytochrome domain-containing protein [Chitinophagaceae bacterium]
MQIKHISIKTILLFIVPAIFFACRHEILDNSGNSGNGNGGGVPPAVSTCSPDTVYFVNEIMPIISSNCTMSGCHDNITHAEDINLTTYSNIMRYVVPGNASSSKLYKVIIKTDGDRMPPPPMAPLTTEQKSKIQKWINQGAKNNNCIGSCDTTVFTYSGAVKNIINNNCAGCHNPSSLGGNIDLSAYNGVHTAALNGKLYGSIANQPGYSPMPKNSKLSDCEIRQIQKWIAAGSLNN